VNVLGGEKWSAIEVHRLELAKVERAVIDGEADGFVAMYTYNGLIVGTTFVAAHTGESLPLLTLAVAQRMTPASLAAVIHCYPTQVEAIQRVATQASTERERPRWDGGRVQVPKGTLMITRAMAAWRDVEQLLARFGPTTSTRATD
jgi:hypothetical protein